MEHSFMRSSSIALLFTATILTAQIDADEPPSEQLSAQDKKAKEPMPWLTGPLLTPSGHVIPNGHYNIEPYEFINTAYGVYNKHWDSHDAKHNFYIVNTQVPIQIGMPANLDFTFNPSWAWNHIHGASHWVLNDMSWGFDYQIFNDKQ
jgi:hypothetical protein